jgi:replication factor C small subunit
MFAGPAGTGKSSLSLIIVKKLFGLSWRNNYLELNASDERGIDVVRQKVKDFARTKALADVPFKIIFLDEADALTKEAQHALRRTMENYTATCRFILSCNFSSKIIDPIQSRCTVFRFKLLNKNDIQSIIESVSKKEDLVINDEAIEALYNMSEGDCRRIINLLQSSASVNKKISSDLIYNIVSAANPQDIKSIIELSLNGNFLAAREKLLDVMLKQSLSGIDIIKAMQREAWNLPIDSIVKVKLIEKIGEVEFRLVEGSDEYVQLESLLASFVLIRK